MMKIKNVKFLKAAYKKEEIPRHSYKEIAFGEDQMLENPLYLI